MKKYILGIIIITIISCVKDPKVEFSLNGTTNGVENGTVLYLDSNDILIDSTVVENNYFSFKTKLSKSPFQVLLRTKNFSHARFLWLENSKMTFDATNTEFRNAIVTGSKEENLSQVLSKETDSLSREDREKKEIEFVHNHPNSIHSAFLLMVYSTTWGKEKTKELFDNLSPKVKNTEFGKNIAKYIKLSKNLSIGEKYVDFEMDDTKGNERKISDFNDKIVLLEFWGSGCGACRYENPNLVKTYNKFKPKGFEIFAVSLDTKREYWLKAIEEDKLPWIQVSDLKGINSSASMIYGIRGIPDNFLIDQNGIIIGRNLRGDKLREKLSKLFN